ncbi:MAG: tripartite tricarboxylate transporter substrate binding protein [Pseudomonadota bacterium]|nr:tripartite tricarboxylate transporter substrate binding protein [Pseudomonadota bacterium]
MNASTDSAHRAGARALFGTLLALTIGTAGAQSFPNRNVIIVVPFAPAGGADTLARVLAPRLSAMWGQSVIVENRAGASGHIGTEQVANATPDGYTLVMATTAAITEQNIVKLAPVALVSAEAYTLVVNAKVPVANVRELIAYAKANPGKLHFGSSGIGAASHLSGELFKAEAKVDMVHVPYKGTGQALTDLLGGQIELMFAPTQTVIPQIKSGRLRALAVTGDRPLEALPSLPTVASSGLPGYTAQGWFGLLAPKRTPPAVIAKLHDDVNKVLALPEVKKDLLAKGAEPGSGSSAGFGSFIREEQDKWSKLIKDAGIVLE